MLESEPAKNINVDAILEDFVGPLGLWQLAILLTICFSMSSPVLFPIYTNAVPRYRCALDEASETFLAGPLVPNGTSSTNETRLLTFDEKARMVGPWFTSNENLYSKQNDLGCLRFKGGKILKNESGVSPLGLPDTETCINGYVYESMEHQYPSTIIAEWDLVCDNSWKPPMSTSVYMFGMMVGFVLGGFLGGHLGRKKTTYLATILECAFGLGVSFSASFEAYVILRFIVSAASTIKFAVVSVTIVEVTTAPNRAIFSSICGIFFYFVFRALHAFIAMYVQYWRHLHLIMMFSSFVGLLLLLWIPESPRWLVSQKRDEEALQVLYKAYNLNNFCKKGTKLSKDEFLIEVGYSEFVEVLIKQKSSSFKCDGECLKGFRRGASAPYQNSKIAKRSIVSTVLFCGQLCALFGLLFYTQVARFSVYYGAILNSLTSVPGFFISTLLYSKVKGRKKPLMTIYGMAALFLLAGGFYALLREPSSEIPLIVCCNIALVLVGAAMNMLFIYIPELFPSSVRTQCFGNAAGLGRIGSMLCSFVNQLDYKLGHGVPVIIYGVVIFLQVLLTCLLPDTDGENLADHVDNDNEEVDSEKG